MIDRKNKNSNNIVQLPKKMTPDIEDYEKLGFIFHELETKSNFHLATLPKGWRMETIYSNDNSLTSDWYVFIDENETARGTVSYISDLEESKVLHMHLVPRYRIETKKISDTNLIMVYFGNENEMLFVTGFASLQNNKLVDAVKIREAIANLEMQTKKKADELYPEWENALAYWDEEQKTAHSFQINKV